MLVLYAPLPFQFHPMLISNQTNIVERPSAEVHILSSSEMFVLTLLPQAGELSRAEMGASVQALLNKIYQCRPRVVCFVGKMVWDAVVKVLAKHVACHPSPTPKIGKAANKKRDSFVYDHLQPYKMTYNVRDYLST